MTSKTTIPSLKLNYGNLSMPIVGLGTYAQPASGERSGQVIEQAVYDAIALGVRHIDTAWIYEIEDQVGAACKRAINEGLVKREDLFIVTKVWITHLTKERVQKSIKESLQRLQMDYVDCLLVHSPTPLKYDEKLGNFPLGEDGKFIADLNVNIFTETWPAMEEVVKEGLAKTIGVSNYNSSQIREVMKVAKIPPVTNQVECTPFLPHRQLLETCKEFGIVLTAYGPLGGSPLPQSDGSLKEDPLKVSLLDHPVVKGLASKYGKTAGQILLRFHVDREVVVIPKSVRKERIKENGEIFDFKLTDEDITSLLSLENGKRVYDVPQVRDHPNYPLNED